MGYVGGEGGGLIFGLNNLNIHVLRLKQPLNTKFQHILSKIYIPTPQGGGVGEGKVIMPHPLLLLAKMLLGLLV